jgi:hypothetical protein
LAVFSRMAAEDALVLAERLAEAANKNTETSKKVAGWTKVVQFKPSDGRPFYIHSPAGALAVTEGTAPKTLRLTIDVKHTKDPCLDTEGGSWDAVKGPSSPAG